MRQFAQPPPHLQQIPFDPARRFFFTSQTAANCVPSAFCNFVGWLALTSKQLSDFRRSAAGGLFWLSDCAEPESLQPEDLQHYHDGWYTIPLMSAWADRHMGHHLKCCYFPNPNQPQPATADAWIQVLDSLSATHRDCAYLAHTNPTDEHAAAAEPSSAPAKPRGPRVRGHCYALRRYGGLWHVLDSATAESLPLIPGGPLPRLLTLPVTLLHLQPRPAGSGQVVDYNALLPIPTKGISHAPVHPEPPDEPMGETTGLRRPGSDPGLPRVAKDRRTTRAAAAGKVKNSLAWHAAFTDAVRDAFASQCGAASGKVDPARVDNVVKVLVLQHAPDLAGKDPRAATTRRIIKGLVRDDFGRNNRWAPSSQLPAADRRSPFNYPSDSSTDGEPAPSRRRPAAAANQSGPGRRHGGPAQ